MSELSPAERVLRIMQILGSGTRITTTQLLRRFENRVSLRTLQRDLQKVLAADIPLRSKKIKANENEWYLDSNFRSFIPQTINLNEYLAAYILKQNLRLLKSSTVSRDINALLEKIEQLVPENVFIESEQFLSQPIFDEFRVGEFDYSAHSEILDKAISAIIGKRACEVTYFNQDRQDENTFFIHPLKLIQYSGGLYLISFVPSRDEIRYMRIHDILSIEVTEGSFNKTPEVELHLDTNNRIGLYRGEAEEVVLRFRKQVGHHIRNRHWHPSQEFSVTNDGDLILKFRVPITRELVAWILSWGPNVKVIRPSTLIEQIKLSLDLSANQY